MSKAQAKKIVRKYALKLQKENFKFSEIYLFGSYAKGKPQKWSDIDVAIVSDELKKDYDNTRLKLWIMREGVDDRIEPHGFPIKDFENDLDPMVYEIKNTGIKIA